MSRRPRRARPRRRLVRGGAHRVRHPVPAAGRAVRPARGAAGGRHRAVGHAGRGDRFDFAGEHYQSATRPALPKPVQAPVRRSSSAARAQARPRALAARYAAEFNVAFASGRRRRGAFERRRARPASGAAATRVRWSRSAALWSACGRDDAEVARRAAAIGRRSTSCRRTGWPARRPRSSTRSGRSPRRGATRLYLQVLDLADLDHLDLIAAQVAPQLDRQPVGGPDARARSPGARWRSGGGPVAHLVGAVTQLVWPPHPAQQVRRSGTVCDGCGRVCTLLQGGVQLQVEACRAACPRHGVLSSRGACRRGRRAPRAPSRR